jgi:hypothetical protein
MDPVSAIPGKGQVSRRQHRSDVRNSLSSCELLLHSDPIIVVIAPNNENRGKEAPFPLRSLNPLLFALSFPFIMKHLKASRAGRFGT